jgi:energy-coupling factor transporter transmembrane protein EcfT
MWLLHLLPDSLILYITYAMLIIGIVGIILGFFISKIPFVSHYRLPIQIVSILLFCSGLYWYGGYSTEMAWRERVAEMEEKVRQAELKSQAANEEIQNRVAEKTKTIREKGRIQIEYINRLVEGKTVEIVKDMSEEERQALLAKQKELQDAIKNCPIPRVIVEEHNKAAEPR